jgi:hypothetical protein
MLVAPSLSAYGALKFRLSSVWIRVWGVGFGVWGLGFGVWGLGVGVWCFGPSVSGKWLWEMQQRLAILHLPAREPLRLQLLRLPAREPVRTHDVANTPNPKPYT